MATRLFFRASTDNTAGYVATEKSTVLPVGTSNLGGNVARDLSTTAGTSAVLGNFATLAQTTHQDGYFRKFISPTLATTSISAQTWTLGVLVGQSNNAANAFIVCSVYVLKSDDTVRGFVYDSDTPLGAEWALGSNAGRVVTFSGAAVSSVESTDRLAVEFWYHGVQSMAASYTLDFGYDGTTPVVEGATNADPASYIETPQDGLFAASGVTGTLAVTQDAQTSTASGTADPPAFTGTAAPIQDAQASAASGLVEPPASTGTAAPTQADQTSTAAGESWEVGTWSAAVLETTQAGSGAVTGTSTPIQDSQVSAASGAIVPPAFNGTTATTQDDQTSTAAGLVEPPAFTGTSATVQADQTSAASGLVEEPAVTGTLAVVQQDQFTTASGSVVNQGISGSTAAVQENQTVTSSGTVEPPAITGTAAPVQDDQTSTITGTVTPPAFTGTTATVQDDQVSSASGTVTTAGIAGSLNVTQADQASAATGTFIPAYTGSMTALQADQTSAATGTFIAAITGTMAVTQDDQTCAASGLEPRDWTEGHRILVDALEGSGTSGGRLEGSSI